MNTTANNDMVISAFTPSVNILRDVNTEINYIPTPNAKQVFDQLIKDYKTGIHSFNIVGAFGTGKSSFLWAFERNLNRKELYFSSVDSFNNIKKYSFLSLVGEYNSIISSFAEKIGLNSNKDLGIKDIFKQLDIFYNSLHNKKQGLVILIDEFGKFLEYAAKNNPESELYFIQSLAEYVNDSSKNIFFITTLHQDFNGYSNELTISQRNEWDKVKGRLKETTFNEPVEQLLFLASERISQLGIGKISPDFKKLFDAIDGAKAFPLKDYFTKEIAKKLLPFDILASAVLTLSLQKYGQNERSLFSFIESNESYSIKGFDQDKNPYYNLSNVYDYLINNYYSFLTTTKYNPHYSHWAMIRSTIEKVEGASSSVLDALKLVKTIGLLNIFASASIRLNMEFLNSYGKYSLGIRDPKKVITELNNLKIIRFVKHSDKYILFEGIDFDIETAIDEAGNLVEKVTNVVHHLNNYFDFPYISAKSIYYEIGTPRFFAFHLSENPEMLHPDGEIDGFVNLIFSDTIKEKQIKEASTDCEEAILYGWYQNTNEIKTLLFEIEKVKKVRQLHLNDRVGKRELDNILQHQIKLLNHYVIGNLYSSNSSVKWFFKGKAIDINNQKTFNRCLSEICKNIYSKTPIYRNEMVNKTKLSPPIVTARKSFLSSLIENWHEKDFGLDIAKFPPEKTIYLSLLRETGMHYESKAGFNLGEPTNGKTGFSDLWEVCSDFLNSTAGSRRQLNELTEILLAKPVKLKQGFLDFWLPVFLFTKRDDFALFHESRYIPNLTLSTLELVSKDPREYEIKAFNVKGVKLNIFNSYRALLDQSQKEKPSNQNFIETIKPFLVFYKQLPEYAKITKRLDKKTRNLRDAIAHSKDPEDTFFEDFPKALGYTLNQLEKDENELKNYINELQNRIKEIRTCYDELIRRVEIFIQDEIIGSKLSYPDYRLELLNRFKKIKKHLLLPYQKIFYQRLGSEIDDNKDWLNSITQSCIEKSLDNITEEDEKVLYEKLKDIVHELDNLCEMSNSDFNEDKEIVLKLEITSFVEGLQKNLVRLPKSKNIEFIQLQGKVKSRLSDDRQLNIATLAKVLEELLKNEK